jgi:hypothetical protein
MLVSKGSDVMSAMVTAPLQRTAKIARGFI